MIRLAGIRAGELGGLEALAVAHAIAIDAVASGAYQTLESRRGGP